MRRAIAIALIGALIVWRICVLIGDMRSERIARVGSAPSRALASADEAEPSGDELAALSAAANAGRPALAGAPDAPKDAGASAAPATEPAERRELAQDEPEPPAPITLPIGLLVVDETGAAVAGLPLAAFDHDGFRARRAGSIGISQSEPIPLSFAPLPDRVEGEQLYVGLDLPTREAALRAVADATAEIELPRPPLATLVLRVEDSTGAAPAAPVLLQLRGTDDAIVLPWFERVFDARRPFELALEAGLALRLELTCAGFEQLFADEEPLAVGERRERVLRFDLTRPLLCGELVDEHGAPLREAWYGFDALALEAGAESPPDSMGVGAAQTDAAGRFERELPVDVELGFHNWRIRAQNAEGLRLSAPIEFARRADTQRIELGRLALAPDPLIAQGRVIDPLGRPVVKARVRVARATSSSRIDARPSGMPAGWEDAPLSAETDESGRFAFFGAPGRGGYGLLATHRDAYRPCFEPLGALGRELELRLEIGAELEGALAAAPDMLGLELVLQRGDERRRIASLAAAGEFSASRLPSGTWTVALRFAGDQLAWRELGALELRPAERAAPAWLNPLVLPADAPCVRATLVEAGGGPVEHAKVVRLCAGPPGRVAVALGAPEAQGTPLRAWTSLEEIELEIARPGMPVFRAPQVREGARIEVPRAIQLRFALRDADARARLTVELVDEQGTRIVESGPARELALGVPAAGRYRLVAQLGSPGKAAYEPLVPDAIEVLDLREPQTFWLVRTH